MKHWSPAELATLRRLRGGFLHGTAGAADYWHSAEDLTVYDSTFAERIGWKWDAVLRELVHRGWKPESRHVLDWGCGSGVASRRVLAQWPGFASLTLHDRSVAATEFAAERVRREFPAVEMRRGEQVSAGTLLILSHVLNELADEARDHLLELARQADEIVWVESGTHANSRRLVEVREALRSDFRIVAPCTHQAQCGMLAPENGQHWCHHFAPPAAEVFQDARWAEFGRELEIDLRSVPYSFLVLDRRREQPATPPGFSRIIGTPRDSKGYSRVLSSQESGVTDLMLQKRDAPELLKAIKKGRELPIYRWEMEKGRIVGGEPLPPAN